MKHRIIRPMNETIQQFSNLIIEQYNNITIEKEELEADMIFKSRVTVGTNCKECLVILKQTYHPNWRASVDGKPVKPITVFPFYLAVPVSEGTHDIIFSYQPSQLKIALLLLECIIAAYLLWKLIVTHLATRHA
ncbi:YfhO family protein [Candidatus Gottesmanbacteria bacterium]|nr:YfhO family protein [Candidatus Gottesmanbacteria bacterium]